MGQAKLKRRFGFDDAVIDDWEADDCVNFAIALARLTGWLLHVDWWSFSTEHREDISVSEMRPLRVYAADNANKIFDVRGTKTIAEFRDVIYRQVLRIRGGNGGVYTRFYSEETLWALPLKTPPSEEKIAKAIEVIQSHPHYLSAIPGRPRPAIPSHEAAKFTFGMCAAFAEAMHELVGLSPVAILAVRFSPLFEGTKRGETGYFHSVVLHPDGLAEDSWGIASLEAIADRFGVVEFKINADEHVRVIEKLKKNTPELFDEAVQNARALIEAYRQPAV